MLAFSRSRLTSALLLLLSFTFFVSAYPTRSSLSLRHSTSSDKLLTTITTLHTQISTDVKLLTRCETLADVSTQVNIIVGHVQSCAEDVLALGRDIQVDASVRAEVAAKVAAVIALIVHACLEVALKLGFLVVLGLFSKLDVCLNLLLVNLSICVEEIVALVAEIVVSSCADVLMSLKFNLCLGVLAIVGF